MGFVTRAPRSVVLGIGAALMVAGAFSPRVTLPFSVAISGAAAMQAPSAARAAAGRPLKVLFLGQDQPAHGAGAVFQSLAAPLARRGIQLTPVLTPAAALAADKLAFYDALVIYGNHTALAPDQEKALLDFVDGGKGVIAIHSAAEMFGTSARYASLIGAQATMQGGGEFTAEIVAPAHAAVQGVKPFATWDESIVTGKQGAADRTVLMERVDGDTRTPYTWVRTQGKGRVFYTGYGHDQRTWGNPGFHTLIEHAIVWAVPEPARVAFQQLKMPEVTYVDGMTVPNYENRDPAPKYQLPFAEEDARKFIAVPAEFSLDLFASEPDIVKPIAFAFDERGRMWIAETVDYPNEALAGNPGDDRIRILEDTNGDGRADKFTVFADHLNIPTSLVFANGGVIVAQPPHILFLKDTNGDDKADERKILSTGWGQRDTHAVLSQLQYGLDNYIWGVVGYSGFNGEINGKKFQFAQAAFRFRPDGSDFEVMTGSTNNTWGLGFTETFDVFGSTANNDPSFYMAIPNRFFDDIEGLPQPGQRGVGSGYQSAAAFYNVHPMTPYIRQVDVFNGYTAGAGHYFYTARQFPKEYWNRIAFINEPTAHLIGQGVIEKQGAGFVTRDGWNLAASAEEWFAPVHTQVGPDGAVWFADWYNFIIQHNPTPQGFSNGPGNAYETSLRDHRRGRIYRIGYKNATAPVKRSLSIKDTAGLLSALSSDNMLWRLHAQRLLVERGQKDVVPQLIALVKNPTVDAIGINGSAMHALWTLKGLGEIDAPNSEAYRAAVAALKHPAAGVRKAAAMVLPKNAAAASALLSAGAIADQDLHTRLAATLVVAEMPESPEIGAALYRESQKADNYGDKWLSRAFYIAANHHKASFTTAYKADKNALPFDALPIALRLGALKPDWRQPNAGDIAADWKDMQVPGNWESRGLPDFDGVVWFTRTIDIPAGTGEASLALGTVRNTAEVWVNGLAITPPAGGRGAGGGRGFVPPSYTLPVGTLKPGPNQITVRIQNPRNDGGFIGTAESMFVQVGSTKTAIAGPWKYRVERQTNAGTLYSKPGELAAHVAFTAAGGPSGAATASLKPVAPQAPDITLRIAAVPGQLKYDLSELT
ncbi:MAG TPA: PVC-type heme-binding CxxCH protein, partial [Vicinamibacterales bacterium]|nr:PVC-type heme-binding CxxCH protein [Vicinamibacterales bacterium]